MTTINRAGWAEIDPLTLHDLIRLRVDVFVVEQLCAYAELDGRDLDRGTVHLRAGPAHQPTAYLRLLTEPGGTRRIGRVCTAPAHRGRGLARRLVAAALAEVGPAPCVLDAQAHLTGLYADFGFTPDGPGYDWDGVLHVPMRRVAGGGAGPAARSPP